MARPTVVFVHGRGQEFKAPARLLRTWLGALNAGLVQADLPPLQPGQVAFPFYGDALYRATAASTAGIRLESMGPDEAGPLDPATPPDVGRLERQIIADMARHAGVPAADAGQPASGRRPGEGTLHEEGFLRDQVLGWRAARELLTALAKRSRVDQLVITAQLRDVAMYLSRGRDEVLDVVRKALPADGPVVLVSHSLGTVVARDLLQDGDVRERTVLWVTTGSPLGLEAVQKNLLAPGAQHPGVEWVSAYDVNDVVALGHPLRRTWGPPLTDIEVENDTDPHSISRYLSHAPVAERIGRACG